MTHLGWLVDPTDDMDSYDLLTDYTAQLRPYWVRSLNDSAGYFDNFAKDIVDITSDVKSQFETEDEAIGSTLAKLEFLIRTYAEYDKSLDCFLKNILKI